MLTLSAARWLLVLHTGLGVAAVAAGTHLVVWMRRWLRGAQSRRAVVKFAVIFCALQAAAFIAGNVMYPTYKVEVRAAYLENAGAVASDQASHDRAVSAIVTAQHGEPREAPVTADLVRRTAHAARWFDVKEHWIALGLLASAAVLLILTFWDPSRDGAAFAPIVVGLATIACATVWLGAIIGVLTAAWRAV
ncbi:MAG: hypothetical protein ABJE66_08165 [Deltaproteobacteria bacterium]